jgi:general secretion pathway protein A
MYKRHFGFSEAPFSIAPDPRYLYLSERHTEALAHLTYGVEGHAGGFVLLTGEVGTGKTTVCRCLLEQLPEDCDVAIIFNPKLTIVELLSTVCDELGIAYPSGTVSVKVFVDALNAHLLSSNARGRKTVLIIDEAQNLSAEVLEQLRLLTNLETNERKLLQILLLGQPELQQRLAQPELRQLAQRIIARYHLERLSRNEVGRYVAHRLAVADGHCTLFPPRVIDRLYRVTQGTPRLINVVCDRALLGAYVQGRESVDWATLDEAASEVFGKHRIRSGGWRRFGLAALAMGVAGVGLGVYHGMQSSSTVAAVDVEPAAGSAPAAGARPAARAVAAVSAVADSAPSFTAPRSDAPMIVLNQFDSSPVVEASAPQRPDGNKLTSQDDAVRALARLWGAELPASEPGPACEILETRGLRCLSGVANIVQLRQMNVPVVLRLQSPSRGPDAQAVLLSLESSRATLLLAGETRTLATQTLAGEMTGDYVLIWRGPTAGTARQLKPGARGREVAWLHQRFAAVGAGPESVPNEAVFDATLQQRLREFQRRQGLVADGVAGPVTVVRLALLDDPEAPTLAERP